MDVYPVSAEENWIWKAEGIKNFGIIFLMQILQDSFGSQESKVNRYLNKRAIMISLTHKPLHLETVEH